MSKIAFVNNNPDEEGHVINTLISYRNWEEYSKLKDMDKHDLCLLMQRRNRERIESYRMKKAVEKAINSNEFDSIIEKDLQKIVQAILDKE